MDFEKTILFNMCVNNDYTQKINGHIKKEFFDEYENKELFLFIQSYINEFKTLPTKSSIQYEIDKSTKYNEKQFENIIKQLNDVFEQEKQDTDWLFKETEKYCQNICFKNALIKCYEMYQENDKNKASALDLMKDALSIEFDTECGIDFFDEQDIEQRYNDYNTKDAIYETGYEDFDTICGGLKVKGVSVLMGGSHSGKTADMICLTKGCIEKGYNVAYFSMEMDEKEISKRYEANLLNKEINAIRYLEKDFFKNELLKIKEKSYGRLKIKDMPTGLTTVNDCEKILNEWKIKHGFVPHIIVFDYLNIMASSRIKDGNSYSMIKAIIEEMRGLCVKKGFAGLTGTQVNREGMGNSKYTFKNISDSVATIFTADLLIGIISTEEMRKNNYQAFQVMKNRNTGIIDYIFPMQTNFLMSQLFNCSKDIQDSLFLNNNPETTMRIEKLKKMKDKYYDQKFNNVVLKKKETVEMEFTDDDEEFYKSLYE